MDAPHLGVVLPNYGEAFDPGRLAAAAAAAEAAGLDSGWLTDHVLPPSRHAAISGTIAEALVAAGFVAGRTGRLRVGVSALIVPQREPLLTLKQLVSLDVLSSGRLITAVAAGWMEEEFHTLGASFPDRGRRLDEWLELAGDLLRQAPGRVIAEGPVPVSDAWLAPAPTRPEGLELWVAGVSRHTLRRAARTGVWHPVALPLRELRSMAAAFRADVPEGRVVLRLAVTVQDRLEEQPRDERGRPMVAGPGRWVAEQLNDYLEGGADGFVVDLGHDRPGLEDRIAAFAAEVAPLLVARRPAATGT
jgi:alkanesulfonate monooxygenase SsuD/methylene tetrahydromethanopterin reductase-like flavin-dependent oxidoreductase (luciferase family)